MIEATAHLNIAGCTHMHTGCAWYQSEKGATDGKMTRFDCVAVEALYDNLPNRETLEELGNTINETADLFSLLNLVKTITDIIHKDVQLNGVMLLTDDAFTVFQDFVNNSVNPELNKLVMVPAAGAQTSSWSKMKGKVLKLSGVLFILSLAVEMLDKADIMSFDFENQSPAELRELVRPHIIDRLNDPAAKVIPPDAVKYAIPWGMMFHETGLALQENMVPLQRLPRVAPLPNAGGAGVASGSCDNAPAPAQNAALAPPSEAERKTAKQFADPLHWGCYAVITCKKFESRIISASYMSTECARLVIGGVASLTGGQKLAGGKPRPTFYAIAKELERVDLATLIWQTEKSGKRKLASQDTTQKLWGIELFDADAAEADAPGSVAEPLSQILSPYQISVEHYRHHCSAMTPQEASTFSYPDLVKFTRNPAALLFDTVPRAGDDSSVDGDSIAAGPLQTAVMTATEGVTIEASPHAGRIGTPVRTRTPPSRRSTRIAQKADAGAPPDDAGAPPSSPAPALAFAPAPSEAGSSAAPISSLMAGFKARFLPQ